MPSLTLARPAHGTHPLCARKVVAPDGSQESPQFPLYYAFERAEFATLRELRALLARLRDAHDTIVVRGEYAAEQGRRNKENLRDTPQAWAMLDFDSAPDARGDFAANPAAAAEALRAQLPLEFREAGCVWRASGSAGIKAGIRLHLWFLLSSPVDSAQLKIWLGSLKVDHSLFSPTQPHFTSDPDLSAYGPDPMAARIGVLEGRPTVEVPAFELPTAGAAPIVSVADPLIALAINRYLEDHEIPELAVRETCLACGAEAALAALPDGKWYCHGAGHEERTPVTRVGHPIEFLESIPQGEFRAWLAARYPDAFRGLTRATVVDPDATPPARIVSADDAERAYREFTKAITALKRSSIGYEQRAERLGRYVPEYLSAETVCTEFCALLARTKPLVTRGEAEPAIKAALARGAAMPAAISQFACADNGRPMPCDSNLLIAMHDEAIAPVVAYDTRAAKVQVLCEPPWAPSWDDRECPRPFDDDDARWLVMFAKDHLGYPWATAQGVMSAVQSVALERAFDPVTQYLDALSWDHDLDTAREWLSGVFVNFAGAADDAYSRAVTLRWFLGAVQRAYEPGCKQRTVIVLQGKEYTGKSAMLRELMARKEWLREGIGDIGSKDAQLQLLGCWLVELPEIEGFLDARDGLAKAFLTRVIDSFRPPFERTTRDFPRRVSMVGTTNSEALFRDRTGNTRFSALRVGVADLAGLREARDLIWAAAVALYRAGEQSWLTDAEMELSVARQQEFEAVTACEDALADLLGEPAPPYDASISGSVSSLGFHFAKSQIGAQREWLYLTSAQVAAYLLHRGARSKPSDSVAVFRRAGWSVGYVAKALVAGTVVRGFMPPLPDLSRAK